MLTQTDMTSPHAVNGDLREVGAALQCVLVDLIDLASLGKHAHWNVEGPRFRMLHDELDEFVDAWRQLADDVAERAAALGWAPDGQTTIIARSSQIDPLPAGPISDDDVIDGLTGRLSDVIARARVAMGEAAVRDSVSEDVLIDVVRTLEKQHWVLRSQQPPAA